MNHSRIVLCGVVGTLMLAGGAHASFTLIDNFQGIDTSSGPVVLNGTNGWSDDNGFTVEQDSLDAANNVGDFANVSDNNVAHKAATIGAADTGTLFFRFRLQNTTHADLSVGMSSSDTATINTTAGSTSANLIGPTLRIVDTKLQIWDSAFVDSNATSLDVDAWYLVWMVIDNTANTWGSYIQREDGTGPFASQTQLTVGADTSFIFRGSNDANALVNFTARANNNNGASAQLLDDLYVDSSMANLSNPIPEPASLGLLVLGGLAMFKPRRRG